MHSALSIKNHVSAAWHSPDRLMKLSRLAARTMSLTLIVLIAWLIASTLLALTLPRDSLQTPADPRTPQTPAPDADTLAEAGNLFGIWQERTDAVPVAHAEVPTETSLPLRLIGVYVSASAERSAAIIARGSEQGVRYVVGERIPGNAVLASVNANSVMLTRAGRTERLSFPDIDADNAIRAHESRASEPPPDVAPPIARTQLGSTLPEVSSLGEKIEEYRSLATRNPDEALQRLGLQPVSQSEASGYRVADLPDNPWVRRTGLQDGDLVLSVNGRAIGDPQLDRLEIDNLFAEGRVRLEIQRGERRFFVDTTLAR